MSNVSAQFRSPEALMVLAVLTMLVAAAVSGMVAPAPDASTELAQFVRDHWKRYSQHDEEVLIRYFFKDRRDGVFLDVGCAWPIRNSTTYYLEHHLGWSGIAIDALAEYGPDWAASRPNSRFLQYAVSNQSGGTITFYRGAGTAVSSIDKDHTIELSHAEPTAIEVPTITLNDLLDEAGVERIDFMSMDIEGAEPMALAGFDIERFGPQLVCIEGRWSENAPKIRAYFDAHGYELLEEYNEYEKANWYFQKSGS